MRIGVADNDLDVLDLLVMALETEGHEVVFAVTGGAAAVERCIEERPEVLVVDFRMPPGPNGIEVARRVAEASPGTRVILYTNYRRPDLELQAAEVGAEFMAKGNIRALHRALQQSPQP